MNSELNGRFEPVLPEGYQEVFTIDADNKKTARLMNTAGIVTMMIIIGISALIIRPGSLHEHFSVRSSLLLSASILAMVILHELIHGAAYKCLTKQKLTFGMTMSVAYCGVPDIYVYRRTALISLLAPFLLFLFAVIPVFFLQDKWDKMYVMTFQAVQIGGCVGDLYDTFLYLFRFKDPKTLMRDTGPKQTFYQKKHSS